MAEHKVKVNPEFRGELTLSMYDQTLRGGNTIVLTDEQFNKAEVRVAINRKYLIEEGLTIEEVVEEPTTLSNILDKAKEDVIKRNNIQGEIDPRDFEEKSTPVVWDVDKQEVVNAAEGAKKALTQLNDKLNMEVKSGETVKFSDNEKEEPKKKIRVKKTVKTKKTTKKTTKRGRKPKNQALKEAEKEIASMKSKKTLPIPDVGEIDFVEDGEIAFVDEEQKIEKIRARKKVQKRKNNEEIG